MTNDVWENRFHGNDKKKKTDDHRTKYEIDMARIIHSAAFRRLQGKTQIMGLGDSDFYRTRLTHSIEVAQIASGIVRNIEYECNNNNKEKLNVCDISELKKTLPSISLITGISLAHDIGHPPFGHGGEVALNFLMDNVGGFEGNAQTLRVLNSLETRSKNGGLNLTRRTLLGILKYPSPYSKVKYNTLNQKNDNMSFNQIKIDDWTPPKCYYDEDQEIVDWILEPVAEKEREKFASCDLSKRNEKSHNKSLYKSFDASIMDLADEISYAVHDLEDAIEMQLISKDLWESESKNCFNKFDKEWLTNWGLEDVSNRLYSELWERKDVIGALINILIANIEVLEIHHFQEPLFKYKVQLRRDANEIMKCLKNIVYEKVILNPRVQTLEYRGLRIITELFQAFTTNPKRLLPDHNILNDDEKIFKRGIADYIARMTDESANKMYERLFIPREGSVYHILG